MGRELTRPPAAEHYLCDHSDIELLMPPRGGDGRLPPQLPSRPIGLAAGPPRGYRAVVVVDSFTGLLLLTRVVTG